MISKPATESGEPAPCPHCGCELFRDSDHHGEWWGHKWNGCWNDVVQLHDKEDVEKWNRRPSPPTEPQGERAAQIIERCKLDVELGQEEPYKSALKIAQAFSDYVKKHQLQDGIFWGVGIVDRHRAGGERVVKEGELEAAQAEKAFVELFGPMEITNGYGRDIEDHRVEQLRRLKIFKAGIEFALHRAKQGKDEDEEIADAKARRTAAGKETGR